MVCATVINISLSGGVVLLHCCTHTHASGSYTKTSLSPSLLVGPLTTECVTEGDSPLARNDNAAPAANAARTQSRPRPRSRQAAMFSTPRYKQEGLFSNTESRSEHFSREIHFASLHRWNTAFPDHHQLGRQMICVSSVASHPNDSFVDAGGIASRNKCEAAVSLFSCFFFLISGKRCHPSPPILAFSGDCGYVHRCSRGGSRADRFATETTQPLGNQGLG